MKKDDFENSLQNKLFPQMPLSFEKSLKTALSAAGVSGKSRPSAAKVFAGVVSLGAAAACLVILLAGFLGHGKEPQAAALLPEPTLAPEPPVSNPWQGTTKVICLSPSLDFENEEKLQALSGSVLDFLNQRGEPEPKELWLCGLKYRWDSREDPEDGYILLAQHRFEEADGPELYFLSDSFEVEWATVNTGPGPKLAVHFFEDSRGSWQHYRVFFGTEPMIPEPGVPRVNRGLLVGAQPGTDIEFSMLASIREVQSRLTAADSVYPGAAREYLLVSVPESSWEDVLKAHTLRFETLEGPVDVDILTLSPLALSAAPSGDEALPTQEPPQELPTDLSCLTGEVDWSPQAEG